MRYRGIVFDLDGTVADTLLSIAHCANECAQALGFAVRPPEDYRRMVGEGARVLGEKLLGPCAPEVLGRFLSSFRSRLSLWQRKLARLYDGVPELLVELRARGVRCAVLSNKPQKLVVELVEHLLAEYPFAAVLGQQEGIALKPDPEPFYAACRALAAESAEVLVLGDTACDMQGAQAAGMVPVGVLWGFRSARELVEAGAAALVARPAEVLPLIEGLPAFTFLATERLVLRPTCTEDVPALERFWRDPEANLLDHGSPDPGVWTESNVHRLQLLLRRRPSKTMWSILLPPRLEVIGYIRVRRQRYLTGEASIGVRLGRTWWGRGYGPEALVRLCRHLAETKRLRAIELEVLSENRRAFRAYRKAGFRPVRRYRRDGKTWQLLTWHAAS